MAPWLMHGSQCSHQGHWQSQLGAGSHLEMVLGQRAAKQAAFASGRRELKKHGCVVGRPRHLQSAVKA